ncbi:hypothetical protein LOD99_13663 [Oopsacas minuta]|uniref:BZIP domain-containing protein n=1 Tax=Oopsacas minuta TaxID=111878 RepID=A0AAV7KKR3_9METZ|nr:hypothetical protein LOD99_13663 [Oopsacas minuta]
MCAYYIKREGNMIDSSSLQITPPNYCPSNFHDQLPQLTPSPSPPPSVLISPQPIRTRPNQLYLKSFGIAATRREADTVYLLKKCQESELILKQNWRVLLPKCNFLKIVDKNKVAYDISGKELNRIFSTGFFTDYEMKFIKKMRYQGRNNMAAKLMREKYKSRDRQVELSMEMLRREKLRLKNEKEQLIREIEQYKKFFDDSQNQN